ncbi:DevR family CRISPR-associated autoregulator [Chloroflexus sp.]|uniref:DevR family CRISPR-associated autoregulator n=1 Tax=Chloroflexus sp. TaxID=1904827 RepID=UPI002ACE60CC|nr:DevR family CRISPR-associated autoregulator [Chloroflexus sp.]
MSTFIYSISLAINATLDMHNLNNEGNEGNQLQTRMVDIIGVDGQLYSVNAISGDMLKHIQAEHLFHLARERNLPLCAGCQQFNPNRINADANFINRTKGQSDAKTIDDLLKTCAIDDIEGILITEGGRSIPRKSVIEFGWAVGKPETREGHNQSFFHVKYAPERSEEQRKQDATQRIQGQGEEKVGGANLQQAIFYRPASSGQYAIVCHLEFGRVGYNDIRQDYTLPPEERAARGAALLDSVLYTFVQLNGAMRSAQLPHLVTLEGALAFSTTLIPAPLISPLAPDYADQMQRIGRAIGGNQVCVKTFTSLAQFAELMRSLSDEAQPYTIKIK